jgi:hypothetical protein
MGAGMKASHTTTPRTLADCDFQLWGDPFDRPMYRRESLVLRIGRATVCLAAVAAIGAMLALGA